MLILRVVITFIQVTASSAQWVMLIQALNILDLTSHNKDFLEVNHELSATYGGGAFVGFLLPHSKYALAYDCWCLQCWQAPKHEGIMNAEKGSYDH